MKALMACPVYQHPILQVTVLMIAVYMVLGQQVTTSGRKHILFDKLLSTDSASWLVSLYHEPQQFLQPALLIGDRLLYHSTAIRHSTMPTATVIASTVITANIAILVSVLIISASPYLL